jgi:metal-responsive CopG/Arc/MetJ family transcriptional regulator
VAVTPEELDKIDAQRGERSRSDFLREVIARSLPDFRKVT